MNADSNFILAVEGLTVSFDGFKAVDDLSLYIEKNEVRAVIGPNGAGKTTVLDLISGRTRASDGEVKFNGHDLIGLREHEIVRLGVGRKFQTPSVYESLTVEENLVMSYPKGRTVFGAWLFRKNGEVRDKVAATAEVIHLKDKLHDLAETLSHGEKQWLEIGMLLIQDCELMMLDEPVAGMSVSERERTAELINRISEGRALLVVEHDMEFVKRIAHRVTVLHQGKWLAEGKMEAVQQDPKVIEVYLGH
ncbi:MAG TPA: urea ABC transporter ATP-binding protein UrtD [Polyangia bacterium]